MIKMDIRGVVDVVVLINIIVVKVVEVRANKVNW